MKMKTPSTLNGESACLPTNILLASKCCPTEQSRTNHCKTKDAICNEEEHCAKPTNRKLCRSGTGLISKHSTRPARHLLTSSPVWILSTLLIHFLLIACWSSSPVVAVARRSPSNQIDDDSDSLLNIDDGGDQDDEPLFDPESLKHFDLKQLLEISAINKSVTNYRTKLDSVKSSLNGRVKHFLSSIQSVQNENEFSPELRAKLNETFWKFLEQTELSPYCLASLQIIRNDVANKKLWPLKCKHLLQLFF